MVDRAYNIVYISLSNNKVDFSIETCTNISITEAEKRIMVFAEAAIQHIKDQGFQTITITKHRVTIETKNYDETTKVVYAVVEAH